MFIGFGSPFFNNSLYGINIYTVVDFEFANIYYKNIPLIATLAGTALSIYILNIIFFNTQFLK